MSTVWNYYVCDKKRCVDLKYIQDVKTCNNDSLSLYLGNYFFNFKHFVEISQEDLVLTKLSSADKVLEGKSYPSEIVPTSEYPKPFLQDDQRLGFNWSKIIIVCMANFLKSYTLPPLSNFPGYETRGTNKIWEDTKTSLKNWKEIKKKIKPIY